MKLPSVTCKHLLQLHSLKEKEHVVLDVRDTIEFEAGHIKDSINIPHREIQTNIENLIPDKEQKVIVIAGTTDEDELHKIGESLSALGYKNAELLDGGFDEWCDIAPLEVEPELTELTPEESGAVGHGKDEEPLDPHVEEDEPVM